MVSAMPSRSAWLRTGCWNSRTSISSRATFVLFKEREREREKERKRERERFRQMVTMLVHQRDTVTTSKKMHRESERLRTGC